MGGKFRGEMQNLMDELNSSECHFVRCLKSNEGKNARTFNNHKVLS